MTGQQQRNPCASELMAMWIDTNFDDQVAFLQQLVSMPTDTPPGDNAAHADMVGKVLQSWGWDVETHAVPEDVVQAYGMKSVSNLIVRRQYDAHGPVIALNAHGDVVPPGEGWTVDHYAGTIRDGRLYGRAAAVSKSDFSTYLYAVRALEAAGLPLKGSIELHLTYDEEFGGLLGPGWLLEQGLTKPDYAISAGFSYNVVTAHNGCLQLEVTVNGKAAHGATPHHGHDALQAAVSVLQAVYALRADLQNIHSATPGIEHPTLIVGQIDGGINTNVVPGKVTLRIDRRMIPEEDPDQVEAQLCQAVRDAVVGLPGISVEIRQLLLARALRPQPGHEKLVESIQKHGQAVMGVTITSQGSPLYTDARLYSEHGIPVVLYGAGPRTLAESNAKQADEHLVLTDLRAATKVVALTLADLLCDA